MRCRLSQKVSRHRRVVRGFEVDYAQGSDGRRVAAKSAVQACSTKPEHAE